MEYINFGVKVPAINTCFVATCYWRYQHITVDINHLWVRLVEKWQTRRSLTWRSSSGVHIWDHAFEKDTLSISCRQAVCCWSYIIKVAVLQTYVLSVNKIDVIVCFSKITCQSLLGYFKVHLPKISDTRPSYCRGTARCGVSWNLVNCCTTVRKISFKKACSSWITAKKTTEWVLNKAGVKRELLDTVKARKLAYYGHTMRKQGNCLEKEIMQGTMPGARMRGRPHTALIDNIKMWTGLSVEESVRMTEDREINGESTSMVWPTLRSRTAN